MSSRGFQANTNKTGIPSWAIVVCIITIIILLILTIVFFVQLQSCIGEARNNVPAAIKDETFV